MPEYFDHLVYMWDREYEDTYILLEYEDTYILPTKSGPVVSARESKEVRGAGSSSLL